MDKQKLIQWAKETLGETEQQSKKDMWSKGYRSALAEIIEKSERGDFDSPTT